MQQDRTFVPNADSGSHNDLYSRRSSAGNGDHMRGTFVPGMQNVASSVVEKTQKVQNEIPVVGFLYSISRQGIGEYWPLHLGTNTIGRSADCDIHLREMSVSSLHAKLSIKQMKTTGAFIATIRDEGSRTGMFVNDLELDYDAHNCKNGDIITVGTSYKLLLIIINAKELGLSVSETFVADNEPQEESEDMLFGAPQDSMYTQRNGSRRYEGTVDLSGANQFDMGNGTKIM